MVPAIRREVTHHSALTPALKGGARVW